MTPGDRGGRLAFLVGGCSLGCVGSKGRQDLIHRVPSWDELAGERQQDWRPEAS